MREEMERHLKKIRMVKKKKSPEDDPEE